MEGRRAPLTYSLNQYCYMSKKSASAVFVTLYIFGRQATQGREVHVLEQLDREKLNN